MWNEKSSCSPTAAIGDATAMTRSAIPRAKSAMRQPGTGCPRRASVCARTAYATAMSAIGASCRGSNVQLVRSESPVSDTGLSPLRWALSRVDRTAPSGRVNYRVSAL